MLQTNRTQHWLSKYHVNPIPCFVMVINGTEVSRVVGRTSYDRLERMCKAGVFAIDATNAVGHAGQSTAATGSTGLVQHPHPRWLLRLKAGLADPLQIKIHRTPPLPTLRVRFRMQHYCRSACGCESKTAMGIRVDPARSSTPKAEKP